MTALFPSRCPARIVRITTDQNVMLMEVVISNEARSVILVSFEFRVNKSGLDWALFPEISVSGFGIEKGFLWWPESIMNWNAYANYIRRKGVVLLGTRLTLSGGLHALINSWWLCCCRKFGVKRLAYTDFSSPAVVQWSPECLREVCPQKAWTLKDCDTAR